MTRVQHWNTKLGNSCPSCAFQYGISRSVVQESHRHHERTLSKVICPILPDNSPCDTVQGTREASEPALCISQFWSSVLSGNVSSRYNKAYHTHYRNHPRRCHAIGRCSLKGMVSLDYRLPGEDETCILVAKISVRMKHDLFKLEETIILALAIRSKICDSLLNCCRG